MNDSGNDRNKMLKKISGGESHLGDDEDRRVIPLFHTGPESYELTRIDKCLDSC